MSVDDKSRTDLITERERAELALAENLKLTESILGCVPGGVVHVGADGAIKAANAEALRILGFSYDQISRKYTQDWDPETVWEDGSPCRAEDYPVSRALVTGEAQPRATIGIRRPDGEMFWAVFTAVPLKNEAEEVTGAVVTFLDITERKRMEDALRESEAKLRSFLRSAPDVIMNADREARILFINRAVESIAASPEEIVGTSFFDYVPPEERDEARDYVQRVLTQGDTVRFDTQLGPPRRQEGAVPPSHWSVRMGPLEREREIVGFTVVATDVTELKRSEQERERLRKRLDEAERLEAMGQLAGGIAHDFNNLLTVVQGGIDLLARRLEGTSHQGALLNIAEASARAGALTRQLLAFGRQQSLELSELDLGHVVEGVVEMLRRLVREDVLVDVQRDPGLGAVRADPIEMERVLLNLAANARDAMLQGGTLTIRTRNEERATDEGAVPSGRYVVLEVTDTGDGIDEEVQRRMFEPFFSTKGASGSGLGLASVHGIVTQSGGHIEVQSAKGKGCAIRVLLPRVDVTAPSPTRAVRDEASERTTGTILLVEDDDAVRTTTERILRLAGYEVLSARGGSHVLESFGDRLAEIDLLVSDVVMPLQNGPALARELRQREPGLKVLFVSGHSDEKIAVGGAWEAATALLPKPYGAEALLDQVRRILRE